jgi:hypothetical protein
MPDVFQIVKQNIFIFSTSVDLIRVGQGSMIGRGRWMGDLGIGSMGPGSEDGST